MSMRLWKQAERPIVGGGAGRSMSKGLMSEAYGNEEHSGVVSELGRRATGGKKWVVLMTTRGGWGR